MFNIVSRYTTIIFSCELPDEIASQDYPIQLGYAIQQAVKENVYLSDANLSRANLSGANLSGIDFINTNLTGVDFSYTNLYHADLSFANLSGANLSNANLFRANLAFANLPGAILPDEVPHVPNLDKIIYEILTSQDANLDMNYWHTCETTHCRYGWAIHVAGPKGYSLQENFGPKTAGALIYAKAYPELPIPDYIGNNEKVLADIKLRAGV